MTNQATADAYLNKRDQYLLQTLGLDHDPFAYSSAELELQVKSEDPPFLTYFVDLPTGASEESLLEKLKQPGHAVVYGAAGSGKTMLRYALEAQCRAMADHILVVSQPMGKGGPETASSLSAFVEAFAIDLFVQTIEQFDILPTPPDTQLTTELSRFWHTTIPNFHRNVERHLRQGKPINAPTGISVWWRTWKRIVVRYTPLTAARVQFLMDVLAAGEREVGWETAVADTNSLQQGAHLAHQLSYKHIYYLIDVADTPQLNTSKLLAQLCEIENWLPQVNAEIPISLKLFLPEHIKDIIQDPLTQLPQALISPSFSVIMFWNDPELLKALIANRFRSAGSWIRGIEVLASQEIAAELPTKLIEAAHQSPRRLLQTLGLLIDAHASRDPMDPQITAVDWHETSTLLAYDSPPPPSQLTSKNIAEGE